MIASTKKGTMYKILMCLLCVTVFSKGDSTTKCESLECLDKELVRYIDNMDGGGDIIGDSVSVAKISNIDNSTADRQHNNEGIFERSARFLKEHELRLRISPFESRGLEAEGRTRRLRKIILPILLLLKLKAAIIIPIILSIISLVAFKGLGAGLTALAIAGATGLKSLLENSGQSKVSYEVLPQVLAPQWSRSSVEGIIVGSPLDAGYHTLA